MSAKAGAEPRMLLFQESTFSITPGCKFSILPGADDWEHVTPLYSCDGFFTDQFILDRISRNEAPVGMP